MNSSQGKGYEFASFKFFPDSGELHDRGRIVRCPAQTGLVLGALLLHAGQVVSREQLCAELWPQGDSLSYDDAINKAVSFLRYALRDNSRTPRFIQTLPKRGYRFVAEVKPIGVEAAELVLNSGTTVLNSGMTVEATVADAESSIVVLAAETSLPLARKPRWQLRSWRWVAALGAIIAFSAVLSSWALHRRTLREQTPAKKYLRVGIAPFESSGDAASDLAESFRLELTDALAQTPQLRVNAAHMTPSGGADRREMLALQADVLIFGKLTLRDGQVQLQLELARGSDDSHLATFQYAVAKNNLILLRSEAQQDLLTALTTAHTGKPGVLGSTDDVQTYELYLQAREHLLQWDQNSWSQAADEFRQAIARDPGFAKAYSGLATTLITLSEHDRIPKDQGYEEARRDAQKALTLDPQLPEAHAVLGNIAYHHDWNFDRAAEEYHRAIELDPAQSHYHVWLAGLLCMKGEFAESIQEVDLAHTLDPAWKSPFIAAIFIFYSSGQPDRALAVARQLNQLEPQSVIAHQQLGWTYWYLGQYSRASEEWQQMAVIEKDVDRIALEQQGAKALRERGPKAYAELRLSAIESGKTWNHVSTDFVPSEWFVYAGQTDNAIAALSSQIDRHDPAALQIAVDPAYEPLRHDPRYQMLLRRMGLPIPTPLGQKNWHNIWD
jgi:DNA-binding winged helix-turn-helix (wHTH) protein/Tfp pilus assembly protein PilF